MDRISILQEIDTKTDVHCNLGKIPQSFVYRVKQFFAQVVQKYHTEANVIIYYNKETKAFKLFPSEQSVSHGGVQYKRKGIIHLAEMEGYLRVGTIHSHCDFGAFHSGTDIGDETDFDGIHITFGHNDKDEFTISASIVMNSCRHPIDPLEVIDGVVATENDVREHGHYKLVNITDEQKTQWLEGMDQWMDTIQRPSWMDRVMGNGGNGSVVGYGCGAGGSVIRASRYMPVGEMVVWSESAKETWKNMFGPGPFRIDKDEYDKVVVETPQGLVRFSKRMFVQAPAVEEPLPAIIQTEEDALTDIGPHDLPPLDSVLWSGPCPDMNGNFPMTNGPDDFKLTPMEEEKEDEPSQENP